MKILYPVFFCLMFFSAQHLQPSGHLLFLDPHSALLKTVGEKKMPLIWLAIHENEFEAVKALKWAVTQYGGKGFRVVNLKKKNQRILTGFDGKRKYVYDPNRIFSREGKIKNLHHYNLFLLPRNRAVLKNALDHLKKVKERFLKALKLSPEKVLISLHNNLNRGRFSLKLYQKKKVMGFQVYQNPAMHPKNFILVTREKDFEALQKRKINAVLQAPHSARTNDGSLADYCKVHDLAYFNIETRFGDTEIQKKLIAEVMSLLGESSE